MTFHAIVIDFIVFLLLASISAYRIMYSTIILLVITYYYTHYDLLYLYYFGRRDRIRHYHTTRLLAKRGYSKILCSDVKIGHVLKIYIYIYSI